MNIYWKFKSVKMQKMYIAYDDMQVKQILVLVIILTRINLASFQN